jgi:hypothetical protein
MTPEDLQKYLDEISNLNYSSFIFLILAAGAFITLISLILVNSSSGYGSQDIIIIGLCVTIITAALGHVQSDLGRQELAAKVTDTHDLLQQVILCQKPDTIECQYAAPMMIKK